MQGKKDTSAINISNCAYKAYGRWDDDMNKTYSRLMKVLKSEKDKASLKRAQDEWKTFRDAEFKLYDNMFNLQGGTWYATRVDNRIDLVKQRTVLLRRYYETLTKKQN